MRAGENLVLVDGSSLAFRAFFALFKSGLRRADGTPTWAIYGFFNSLFDLIERKRPDGMAMCFDLAGPTFRHEEYAEYKANRSQMPDDLSVQWPVIKQGVQLLGIPLYEVAGYEADDVIGTVAKDAESKGIQVQIFTGDKDAFQLVDNISQTIRVLMPGRPGKGEILEYGRQEVFEKLGVWPEQVVDYKGLVGDTSDNIPGVKGIGEKTAVALLSAYQTMEGIYAHLDDIKSASQRQKLIDGKDSAFASKALATICLDVPLQFDFEHCQLTMPSADALRDFFLALEFKTLASRLGKILTRFSGGKEGEELFIVPDVSATPDFSTPFKKGKAVDSFDSTGTPAFAGAAAASSSSVAVLEAKPAIAVAELDAPLVVSNTAQLDELLKELKQQPLFSLELETTSASSLDNEIAGLAFAWANAFEIDEMHSPQLKSDYTEANWRVKTAYVPLNGLTATTLDAGEALDKSEVLQTLKPLFEDAAIGKVAQNCKFKVNALSLEGIHLRGVVFDPVLASYLVNPDEKHALKEQAERILNYKTVRSNETTGLTKKQLTINFGAIDKVASCAADDARIALELTRHYLLTMNDDQRYLLFDMELPLSLVLAELEQNGVKLDLPYLKELSVEVSQDLARLEGEIYQLAGHSFNIGSPQQLQKVLFEELNLKTKGKTKTGYSTDAAVLEALRNEHEIIGRILEYRQLSKLRSTYIDSLPTQVSGRSQHLHGDFNQTTTATGRLSSSNPNLQNIPIRSDLGRRIRRAFIASEPDWVILSADYSQIELRLLAHMSGDEILIDAFQKNQDIHARTAGEIFDVPFEQVTSDMRRIGKTLNFALIYQQGAYATAQDLGISTKEAQAFIDKYFARYPKVKGFMQRTVEEARLAGYVSTLWGRRRYFRFLNDRSEAVRKADERAACNAPLQGSAADLMKLAMIRLHKRLGEEGLRAKLVLQVHDELVLEVPQAELEKTKAIVLESMQMDQPFKMPLHVDVGVANNWMDAK